MSRACVECCYCANALYSESDRGVLDSWNSFASRMLPEGVTVDKLIESIEDIQGWASDCPTTWISTLCKQLLSDLKAHPSTPCTSFTPSTPTTE
jgi:hypothetical protein